MVPSLYKELVEGLGKIFDSSQKDSDATKQTKDDIFKTWIS